MGVDVAGRLDDDRHVAGRRVPEQLGERVDADQTATDVGVPVSAGAERVLRVVGMDQAEPPTTDGPDERVERRAHATRLGQVVNGRPGVGGVEADTEPWVVLERLEQWREIVDGGGERLPA